MAPAQRQPGDSLIPATPRLPRVTGTAALIAAAIGLLLWMGCLPLSAAASVRPLQTGISDVFPNDAAVFRNMRRTGSTIALGRIQWYAVAPKAVPANWNPEDPADPHYDWSHIDAWVSRAVDAGLTPVLQIFGAPSWAQGCTGKESPEAVCNPDPADLAAFAKAAVRHFSGSAGVPRVHYWEALNEPNLSLYFQPQFDGAKPVSPDLFRVLQNTFYEAVKTVDPTAIVLLAGLGPLEVPKYAIGPMRFARLLLCMKGGKKPRPTTGDCEGGVHFDIFDIHPYTTGGPTHKGGPNDVEMGDLAKIQRLIGAADRSGRIQGTFKRTPLWITEFGWDSKPPDPGGLPMKIEVQWIAEALHQAWAHNVTTFMWYSLFDQEPDSRVPYNVSLQTGLYFWGPQIAAQKPKRAMYAFRFPFVAFRRGKGLKVWGRTYNSRSGRVVLQAKRGKRWRRIGALHADSAGIFRGFVKTGYGRKKKGSVRARFRRSSSPPFPMRRVGDFYHPPFGSTA